MTRTEPNPKHSAPPTWSDDAAIGDLFDHFRATGDRTTRNELVSHHLWLAERCARKYCNRGEPLDDLIQVGSVGLVKAVERFEPERGHFVAFATATIVGELKRHFRDTTWSVRVPRRPKELRGSVGAAGETLHQQLGRSPTVDEVASYTQLPREHVIEALSADRAYRTQSLSRPGGFAEPSTSEQSDDRESSLIARDLIALLAEREREIVYLTYFLGCTQREIGSKLELSQVQVSRLLRSALVQLRSCAELAHVDAA